MNKTQFGQFIKQKYPAYASQPDDVLADMVLKKYPAYSSMVEEEKYTPSGNQVQDLTEHPDRITQIKAIYDAIEEGKNSESYVPGGGSKVTPTTTQPDTRPPLGTMAFKSDTTGVQNTSKPKTYAEEVADIEERRRADYIAYPDKITQIDKFYNSMIKQLDPSGTKVAKEKELNKLSGGGVSAEAVEQMEKYFRSAGGGGKKNPGVMGVLKDWNLGVQGALRLNEDAMQYNDKRQALIATLKGITGDTGVMTKDDANRIIKALPTLGMSDEAASNKFQEIRDLISSKFGGEKTSTSIVPKDEVPQSGGILPAIGETLLGNSQRIAKDVGTGIRSVGNQKTMNKLDKMASQLEKQAEVSKDPEEKKSLLKRATDIRMTQSSELEDIGKSFSRDVKQNPLWRGLKGGVEVAGTADLITSLPKIVSKTTSIGKNKVLPSVGEIIKPASSGKALREGAIKSSSDMIEGNKIVSAIKEWSKSASPGNLGKEGMIDKIVKSASKQYGGKKFTAKELFDIWKQTDSGFTKSGAVKTSVESLSDKALRDVLRSVIDDIAPGFEKGTKLIKTGIDRSNFVKKAIFPAAVATGVAVGTGSVLNKAGIGRQQ